MQKHTITRIAAIFLAFFFLSNDLIASARALANYKGLSLTMDAAPARIKPHGTSTENPEPEKTTAVRPAPPSATYFAKELRGYIGAQDKDPMNLPKDDLFSIALEGEPENYPYAYLHYRMQSPAASAALYASVNGHEVYTTPTIKNTGVWQNVTLAIDPLQLKTGNNSIRFTRGQAGALQLTDVQLSLSTEEVGESFVPSSVVRQKADPGIFRVLDEKASMAYKTPAYDMPAIPHQMRNITAEASGYALSGSTASVRVSLKVALDRLHGKPLSEAELFYFHTESRSWQAAPEKHIDMASGQLEATVPGGTNYFAGLIQSPEMPAANAYVPTALTGIQAANPAEGIHLMQPPSVSRTGEAAISYPLDIPAGRQGMAPSLALTYNSDQGTGWLGMGWQIAVPMISIDARWGVPTFNASEQNETYLLNGTSLTMEGGLKGNRGTQSEGNIVPIPRSSKQDVRFFEPSMSGYKEVNRHGTTTKSYVWTVTTADKTTFYYGTTDGTTIHTNAMLRDADGDIVKWYLAKIEDKWGNTVHYTYSQTTESGHSNPMKNGGIAHVLTKIEYTGYGSDRGKYSIDFESTKDRVDGTISLRLGVKELHDRRLNTIRVSYDGTETKRWELSYSTGDFYKTLLTRLTEYRSGQEFYHHDLEYFEKDLTYGNTQRVDVDHYRSDFYEKLKKGLAKLPGSEKYIYFPSPLQTSITNGFGVGGSVGLGIAPDPEGKTSDKDYTFSGHLGGSFLDTETHLQLRDISGDGLPDLVYRREGGLQYHPISNNTSGSITLHPPRRLYFNGYAQESESSSFNYGFDFTAPGEVFFGGMNWNKVKRETPTYMTDYNADGFVDMVDRDGNDSRILFGMPDALGNIRFQSHSSQTFNPVVKKEAVAPIVENETPKDFEIVRSWEAPFNGTVNISGTASVDAALEGTVQVGIQYNGSFIYNLASVSAGNPRTINVNRVVNKGDLLLFRVRAGADGQQDLLDWNPRIDYTAGVQNGTDANGIDYSDSRYQHGFLLSGASGVEFSGGQALEVSWPGLLVEDMSDDVVFKVKLEAWETATGNNVLDKTYSYFISAGSSKTLDATKFRAPGESSAPAFFTSLAQVPGLDTTHQGNIVFEIWSTSNVNWQSLRWRPEVALSAEACGEIDKKVYPTVDFQTYNRLERLDGPLVLSNYAESCENDVMFWPLVEFTEDDVLGIFDPKDQGASPPAAYTAYYVIKNAGGLLRKFSLTLYSDGGFIWHVLDGEGSQAAEISDPETDLAEYTLSCEAVNQVFFAGFYCPNEAVAHFIRDFIPQLDVYQFSGGAFDEINGSFSNYEIFYKDPVPLQDKILHWGHFAWSDTTNLPINPTALVPAALSVANDPSNDYSGGGNPTESELEALEGDMNPFEQSFFTLNPTRGENYEMLRSYIGGETPENDFLRLDRYALMGSHMAVYANAQSAPGKFGEKEPRNSGRQFPPGGSLAYIAYSTPLKSKSFTLAATVGGSVPIKKKFKVSLVASTTKGATQYKDEQLTGFMDINGDGYPEILDASDGLKVNYTHPMGGHLNRGNHSTPVPLGSSEESLTGLVASGQYINEKLEFLKMEEGGSAGSSGGLQLGHTRSRDTWQDINGDGLPDYIKSTANEENIELRLNAGSYLEGMHEVVKPATRPLQVQEAKVLSWSVGLNGGMGAAPQAVEKIKNLDDILASGGYSFGVGVGVNETGSKTERMFMDVNGDGLVDQVFLWGSGVEVLVNTGTEFKLCNDCGSLGIDELGKTANVGISGNAAGTIGIGFPVFIGIKLKLALSLNGQLNYARNRLRSALRDMNGDRIPDFVETDSIGGLKVTYGQLDKSNLLKTVTNPLKGSFTLDYAREGNKFGSYPEQVPTHKSAAGDRMLWDMPESKWVMSRLTVDDGYSLQVGQDDLDGQDTLSYAFRYDGGIKSRRERKFLGFTRVQTLSPPNIAWDNPLVCGGGPRIYTSTVDEYYRPTENTPAAMRKAYYLEGVVQNRYQFFNAEEIVYIDQPPPNNCRYGDTVELLSQDQYEYEYRMVGLDAGDVESFNKVKEPTPGNFQTVSWNSVSDAACIFPALLTHRQVEVPQKAAPNKRHLVKSDMVYDKFFNLTQISRGAAGGSLTVNEVITDTLLYIYDAVETRTHKADSLFAGAAPFFDNPELYFNLPANYDPSQVVVYNTEDDGDYRTFYYYLIARPGDSASIRLKKHYRHIVPAPTAGFSNDTVEAPDFFILEGGCAQPGNENAVFYTYHRKRVTEHTYIKETQYQATFFGDVIAQMSYFASGQAAGQTNVLKTAKTFAETTHDTDMVRHATVETLYQGKAPQTMRTYYDGTSFGQTDLTYSNKGNVLTLTGPANNSSPAQRLSTTFTYDTPTERFIIGVSNSYGDQVCQRFDYATGNVLKSEDVNGYPIQYVYDAFHRLKEVWGAKELKLGDAAATMAFAYYPNGIDEQSQDPSDLVPVAITYHNINDPAASLGPSVGGAVSCTDWINTSGRPAMTDPLETATFMDGLSRVIQVKKEASISTNGTTNSLHREVTGITAYDSIGQVIHTSQSISEAITANLGTFNTAKSSRLVEQYSSYDYVSRPVQVKTLREDQSTTPDPDYTVTDIDYDWDNAPGSQTFRVQTDVEGSVSRNYVNALGQNVAGWQNDGSVSALTQFKYDGIGQLLKTTDPESQLTVYEHDLLGRVKEETHPDRGVSTFTFDAAGNLTLLVTPESGTGIAMTYEYNRLKTKKVVNTPDVNDVEYTYGTHGDGKNGAGRLVRVVQGTDYVTTDYRYDEMGNIKQEVREVQVPKAGQQTFTTNFIYDSFGRTRSIQYPDQTFARYLYATGGELEKLETFRFNHTLTDVLSKVLYDGYGNISKMVHGNGAETTFGYSADTRRLSDVDLLDASSNVLLNKTLTYNARGLVSQSKNTATHNLVNGRKVGGRYEMNYLYDGMNRFTGMGSGSGFERGGSFVDSAKFEMTVNYDKAGSITNKSQALTTYFGSQSHNYGYQYNGTKLHRLDRMTGVGGNLDYTYNTMGSVTEAKIAGQTPYKEKYCWSDEQTLRGAGKDNLAVAHYTYDHTGQRLLKGTLNYASQGVDGVLGNGKYSLNPYMVYPNAYFNAQHYQEVVMASKHYYMGSQRVASSLIHYEFNAESSTATDPGAETDLEETLLCLGLSTPSDFNMTVLLREEEYENEVSQDDYDALNVDHCQSDPACLCGMDLYWSINCEDYNIMYWYHPDYLGNTEFVTDFNGDAYQSFWYSPWGETLRERDSRVGTWEGPWLFHAQHLDKETDNYYMLHRYYDPMKRLGWLSVDPMSAARPWLTPYNFVQNNPIMRVDPSGLLDGGPGDPNNEFPGQYVGPEAVVRPTPVADGGGTTCPTGGCHYGQNRIVNAANRQQQVLSYVRDYLALDHENGQHYFPRSQFFEFFGPRVHEGEIVGADGYLTGQPAPITGVPPDVGIGKVKGLVNVAKTNKKALPSLDATGKVHGTLPKVKELGRYSKDELRILYQELKQSVQQRIKVTSRMGRDRPHGQRQGAEQDLIKAIEKHLQNR